MLVDCPECSHKASDRAAACPSCGFPIREWAAEERDKEEQKVAASSRKEVGEVDCIPCGARGFVQLDETLHGRSGFTWCPLCGHSGRAVLCEASDGFYAISHVQLEGFLAGELGVDDPGVDFIGKEKPTGHRYPQAGPRKDYDAIPEFYAKLLPTLCGKG